MLYGDEEGLLNDDHDLIALAHQQGIYIDGANDVLKVADIENPVKDKSRSDLCMPALLKLANSSMFDQYSTALYRYATVISKADSVETGEEVRILKEIYQFIHDPLLEKENASVNILQNSPTETLDDVMAELNSMIGLNEVKEEINTLVNFIKVQKEREGRFKVYRIILSHCVYRKSGNGKDDGGKNCSQAL